MDKNNRHIRRLMAETGVIKLDADYQFKPSRGWYIVIPGFNVWYLHHDGKIKRGVGSDSDRPAFWASEDDARRFFAEWKKGGRAGPNGQA